MDSPRPSEDSPRKANGGALFTDSYAQQSCTAGRASFILGQHPFRTGLLTIGGDEHSGSIDWTMAPGANAPDGTSTLHVTASFDCPNGGGGGTEGCERLKSAGGRARPSATVTWGSW